MMTYPSGSAAKRYFSAPQIGRLEKHYLEERLEQTPSDARCFAQGSSLIC
jgi:hypothetical protein